MVDAPEAIRLYPHAIFGWREPQTGAIWGTLYIRFDLYKELLAENERLKALTTSPFGGHTFPISTHVSDLSQPTISETSHVSDISSQPNPAQSETQESLSGVERYRHKKRGSEYMVIARGRLQVDGDLDNEKVVVYQGDDGSTWVRPEYEFNDGRFEKVAPSPHTRPTEQAVSDERVERAISAAATYCWQRYKGRDPLNLSSPAVFTSHEHQKIEEFIRDTLAQKKAEQVVTDETLLRTIEFVARWSWRTSPPNAINELTDDERFSAIKYHPIIKRYGKPHAALAQKVAVE